ncbi:MAG TPA: VWA domain-containing protein [Candidatus Omnitrophota bacterium]|nr:VWA domain-containing protein [Candidatus Omnitrophota bacterium]
MIIKDPWFLALLAVLPVLWFVQKKKKRAAIRFAELDSIKKASPPIRTITRKWILTALFSVSLACFIIALSRPQSVSAERIHETQGIDIVIALDISGSMQAMDFQPSNRIEVAKEEAKKFIQARKYDKIGLVVFSSQSFTQCPLTLDYDVLTRLLDEVHVGLIKDGTAIGLAIANAVNRLRDSTAKSKIIILITDGANNAGNIDPLTAAELAKTFGIRIYTIGVGKEGLVPFPVDDPLFGRRYVQAKVDMDEPSLIKIAEMTGGRYFRAQDEKALAETYRTIDQLEKSKIEVKEFSTYDELFVYFLIPGMLCLFLFLILENTVFFKLT